MPMPSMLRFLSFPFLIYSLYLLGVILSGFLMQLYVVPSIGESIDISGTWQYIFAFSTFLFLLSGCEGHYCSSSQDKGP